MQGLSKVIEDIVALFSPGGDQAPNAAEGSAALFGTKTTGDLLLNFDHAQIPFGQVIIKGDPKVGHEA